MTTTDKQVVEQRLDLEMLERPHLWPNPGVVFVERYGGDQTGPCSMTPDGDFAIRVHDWKMDTRRTMVYPSAEAVVAAGWKVD